MINKRDHKLKQILKNEVIKSKNRCTTTPFKVGFREIPSTQLQFNKLSIYWNYLLLNQIALTPLEAAAEANALNSLSSSLISSRNTAFLS